MPPLRIALIVPTYNPAPDLWAKWVKSLREQTCSPAVVLIIDSSSTNGVLLNPGIDNCQVRTIQQSEFDHGGTRQLGVELVAADVDVAVFLTQDALLANEFAMERLLDAFRDPDVAAVYGRQLPHAGAHPIEAHARLFNYTGQSVTKSLASRRQLGFKSIFISNSFSAYRISELLKVGGFPARTIFGEDTVVAAKMLLSNKKIQYQADAPVFHSHNYTYLQEFRRYFDVGVLHAREDWLIREFGGATGEGVRVVKSELRYLSKHAFHLIPSAVLRTGLKYVGYRLGRNEQKLPLSLKRKLSMHRKFWA